MLYCIIVLLLALVGTQSSASELSTTLTESTACAYNTTQHRFHAQLVAIPQILSVGTWYLPTTNPIAIRVLHALPQGKREQVALDNASKEAIDQYSLGMPDTTSGDERRWVRLPSHAALLRDAQEKWGVVSRLSCKQ